MLIAKVRQYYYYFPSSGTTLFILLWSYQVQKVFFLTVGPLTQPHPISQKRGYK